MPNDEHLTTEHDAIQVIEEGPALPVVFTEDLVKSFEKGVDIYKRWVSACYRLTRESHWLCRNGKYSLQGPGAEALMNPLGISFERPSFKKDLGDDGFYIYWCEGYVESKTLGRRGYYIGYCDSKDAFFSAKPGWNPKTGEGDIKKSAMTNWVVNAVTRIAGIRDPDPASLKAAGLHPEQIPIVDYSGRRTPEMDSQPISEAQQKRLWAIARETTTSQEQLRVFLYDAYGLQSIRDIPRGQYDEIVERIRAGDGRKVADPAAQ